MRYYNSFYLTSDGSLDIEFLFVEINQSEWRIYILSDIDYGTMSTSATSIHRLTENNQTRANLIRRFMSETRSAVNTDRPVFYICWSEKISDLETAKEIARTWSEITSYYRVKGGNFAAVWNILKEKNIL